MKKPSSGAAPPAPPSKLRIIGGQWRGRKLEFPAVESIRPTPDRVRETVFNWLQPHIAGARCLDLFAGSGALGIEALSRGAREVVFVDREPAIERYLRETLARLGGSGDVHRTDATEWLKRPPQKFDIVFLDPPFAAGSLPDICRTLEERGWLAPGALIYMECASAAGPPSAPSSWTLLKSKTTGQVGYHLARRAYPNGSMTDTNASQAE
jgi:16S rRNA (guanine966-N2)-methyltransferase